MICISLYTSPLHQELMGLFGFEQLEIIAKENIVCFIFSPKPAQDAPVAQRLALRAYSRISTIWLYHKSRSCEERDGRGFKPLLEHFAFFLRPQMSDRYIHPLDMTTFSRVAGFSTIHIATKPTISLSFHTMTPLV